MKTPVPDDEWVCGLVVGLTEMHRRLLGGNDSAGVVEVARNCGVTLDVARAAGVDDYDLKELQRAGVE